MPPRDVKTLTRPSGLSMIDYILTYVRQWILQLYEWVYPAANQKNIENLYYCLVQENNYNEALKLADQYAFLDRDLVYKCKWKKSGVTVQSIDSVLSKIQDKLWAINVSTQIVPVSFEACKRLIDFGLEASDLRLLYELGAEDEPKFEAESNMSEDALRGLIDFENLNDRQKELCRCRQTLLNQKRSFEAYTSTLGNHKAMQQHFDHVFYNDFRNKSPLNVCIDYANDGLPQGVEVCLNYYYEDLKDHLLVILSNFPETLSPYRYRNLIPCLRKGETNFQLSPSFSIKKEPDWSDAVSVPTINPISEDYEEKFYSSNQHLTKFKNRIYTSELLTEWYNGRALEMESMTLLLTNATQLLKLGMELNIKNLKKTFDDMIEFDKVIYDYCCDNNDIYLSFEQFTAMSDIDRMLMATSDFKAKYELLASFLADCQDSDKMFELLETIIALRKRDERVQIKYLESNS